MCFENTLGLCHNNLGECFFRQRHGDIIHTLASLVLLQVPPVTLEWDNLSCHWTAKKKQKKGSKSTKQILFNLSGAARPGRYVRVSKPLCFNH